MSLSTIFAMLRALGRSAHRALEDARPDRHLHCPGPGKTELERRLHIVVNHILELLDDDRIPGRVQRLRALRLAADDLMIAAVAEAGFDIGSFSVPLPTEDRTAIDTYLRLGGWISVPPIPGID